MNVKKLLGVVAEKLPLLLGAITDKVHTAFSAIAGGITLQKRLYTTAIGILTLCGVLAVVLLATAKPAPPPETPEVKVSGLVGVSLAGPQDNTLSRQLTAALEAAGFSVNLLCADGDPATQKGQLQTLLGADIQCLILEPVDALSLLDILEQAKEKGLPVIACDEMLMDTDWVWGYVGFDYYTLGKWMAQRVVQAKGLDEADAKSQSMELFMGAPEKRSSFLLYEGAMEVFTPYLRSGKLTVPSGRTSFEDTCTGGTTADARSACETRLESKSSLGICFAASDDIATGCRQALDAYGYTEKDWPTLIGQGGGNAQAVKDGYQLATYEKLPGALAQGCAEAAELAVTGKPLPDATTLNNHIFDVPAKLLPTSPVEN